MVSASLKFTCKDAVLELDIDRLVIAGWVGKDKAALQHHIDELAELGIAPPGRTPTYMNMSAATLSTSEDMAVVGAGSSGEVEAVIVTDRQGNRYLGVGSDHTDREFEAYDIPASKQMCAKPVAAELWPFAEVADHLDQLVMRSWMTENGEKSLYQEGTLGENRHLLELMEGIPEESLAAGQSFVLFCGTFAAIGGLRYGQYFEFEIYDPILNRSIKHGYGIEVLPQYL